MYFTQHPTRTIDETKFQPRGVRRLNDYTKYLEKLKPEVEEHNKFVGSVLRPELKFLPFQIPVTVYGPDGASAKALALVDSGCLTDGVITEDLAAKLRLPKSKNGVSFAYSIDLKDYVSDSVNLGYNTEFKWFVTSTMKLDRIGDQAYTNSYTVDKIQFLTNTGSVGLAQLLLPFSEIVKLEKLGFIFTPEPEMFATSEPRGFISYHNYAPFSEEIKPRLEFRLEGANPGVKFFIDTGAYVPTDLLVTDDKLKFKKSPKKLATLFTLEHGDLGTVTIRDELHPGVPFEIELSGLEYTINARGKSGQEQSAIKGSVQGTVRLIKILAEKGIVVTSLKPRN